MVTPTGGRWLPNCQVKWVYPCQVISRKLSLLAFPQACYILYLREWSSSHQKSRRHSWLHLLQDSRQLLSPCLHIFWGIHFSPSPTILAQAAVTYHLTYCKSRHLQFYCSCSTLCVLVHVQKRGRERKTERKVFRAIWNHSVSSCPRFPECLPLTAPNTTVKLSQWLTLDQFSVFSLANPLLKPTVSSTWTCSISFIGPGFASPPHFWKHRFLHLPNPKALLKPQLKCLFLWKPIRVPSFRTPAWLVVHAMCSLTPALLCLWHLPHAPPCLSLLLDYPLQDGIDCICLSSPPHPHC